MRLFFVFIFTLTFSVSWGIIDTSISKIRKSSTPFSAIDQLNKLKLDAKIKKNRIAIFKINNEIADCYTDLGLYYKSISLLDQNLKAIESLNTKEYALIANIHINQAQNYEQLFVYEKYLFHVHKYYAAIQKAYPNSAIYKALYYSYLSRYYNIKYQIDKANYYSSNALKIYYKNKRDSNSIPVHKLYAAHIFSLRNVGEGSYINKFRYLDTLNYFLEKELPGNSVKKAKVLISNAALDFDIAYNGYLNNLHYNPSFYAKRAFKLYDKALKMHEAIVGPNHNISARIHGFKLFLYYASGDLNSALNECNEGIKKITDSRLVPYGFSINNYFLISLLKAKNLILSKMNSTNDLNKQFQIIQNLEILEKIWNRYYQDQVHNSSDFMSNMYNESPYVLLFNAYLKLYEITKEVKYIEKIHEYDEKTKYYSLLTTVFLTKKEQQEKELLFKKRQLIYDVYDSYSFSKHQNNNASTTVFSNLEQLVWSYEKFEKETELFKKSKIISLKKIQDELSEGTAVITFIRNEILDKTLYAKIITSGKVYFIPLFTDKIRDKNLLQDLQENVLRAIENQNIEDFKKYSYALYQIVFQKIERILPNEITHIEVIPNAELSNFPFEILLYKATSTKDWRKLPYLLNTYNFNQVLSKSIAHLNSKAERASGKFVLFQPNFKDKNLQDLYLSKMETQQIAERFNAVLYQEELATIATFKEQLKKNTIISVFSHGQSFTDFDATKKGIYFSDGFLSLDTIYHLESQSEFLILGACETGLGGVDNGEGNINLARAFTSIGVKSLLLSLWKIDEESTLEITSSFLSYLDQGFTKSEALQKAKLDYIKTTNPRSSSPFYWAGLQIVGSNDSLTLKKTSYYLWLLLVIPLFGVFYYVRKKRLRFP